MSVSKEKFVLNILIRQNTRLKLRKMFEYRYKDKYPSFSQWIEDVLIKGMNAMEPRRKKQKHLEDLL